MEAILYYVSANYTLVISFIAIIFGIGIYIFSVTNNYDINKKSIRYCGLLTGFSKKEILILSSIIIRTFIIIYTALIYKKDITSLLILILFSDFIYIILKPKKAFFEIVNILAQVILIYFINVLKTYRIEISDGMFVGQVIIILIGIIIIYSIYFFLRNFEELIKKEQN